MTYRIIFERLLEQRLKRSINDLYLQIPIEILTYLINEEKSFDVNKKNGEGETVLMKIVYTGSLMLTKWIVDAGADVNIICDTGGAYALSIAATEGWMEVYNYLLPLTKMELREGLDLLLGKGILHRQRKANHQIERLIEAAIVNDIEFINSQTQLSANLNEYDFTGQTALLAACRYSNDEVVRILLKAGADPDLPQENDSFSTPLQEALLRKSEKIIRLLIEANCRISLTDVKYAKTSHMNLEIIGLLKNSRK